MSPVIKAKNFFRDGADAVGTRISEGRDLREMVAQRQKGMRWVSATKARVGAFTLIELLAVIAIIALLAGLVLGTAGLATEKMRESRVRAEHGKLVTAIDVYKTDLGNFPPDNQDPASLDRYERAGRNSLFYELSGCTFDNAGGGTFTTQNRTEQIKAADLKAAFGVKGVENSARSKKDIPYRGTSFKASEYAELGGKWNNTGIQILIVPLKGPHDDKFEKATKTGAAPRLNAWFYDASTTNRHNMETYDLWTEYTARAGTKTVGNW
jgi:prepilin-type N-terminal cleavage/methylation domain-containing protein